jgi:hypothetical protein
MHLTMLGQLDTGRKDAESLSLISEVERQWERLEHHLWNGNGSQPSASSICCKVAGRCTDESRATGQPAPSYCRVSHIFSRKGSITVRRTRINLRESGSGGGAALNRPLMPNGSCRLMALSQSTSGLADPGCGHQCIASRGPAGSKHGGQ